jgi:hypothetical protein
MGASKEINEALKKWKAKMGPSKELNEALKKGESENEALKRAE